MPPGRWLQSDLISRFRSLNGSRGPMCVFESAWTVDVELYAFHSTESWTGVLGGKDEPVWICMCVSVREKTVRIQLRSRWSARVIRHTQPSATRRSFQLASRYFTWLSKGGKICKCTNKFPGWGKQRGRERCVSGEVAGAFRCDLWGERGAFHLNSARFSREDIDQNEMWSVAREDERESERLGRVGGDCEGVELDEKERGEGEGCRRWSSSYY